MPTAQNLSSSSCPSSHTCSCSKTLIRWSFGTAGTSSSSSLRLSWMTTWSSMCGIEDTTRMEFESVTERMLYVLSEVHNTASSSGPPFIVRLKSCIRNSRVAWTMSMQTLGHLLTTRPVYTDLKAALASGKIQGAIAQEEILSLPLASLALRQRHRVT